MLEPPATVQNYASVGLVLYWSYRAGSRISGRIFEYNTRLSSTILVANFRELTHTAFGHGAELCRQVVGHMFLHFHRLLGAFKIPRASSSRIPDRHQRPQTVGS